MRLPESYYAHAAVVTRVVWTRGSLTHSGAAASGPRPWPWGEALARALRDRRRDQSRQAHKGATRPVRVYFNTNLVGTFGSVARSALGAASRAPGDRVAPGSSDGDSECQSRCRFPAGVLQGRLSGTGTCAVRPRGPASGGTRRTFVTDRVAAPTRKHQPGALAAGSLTLSSNQVVSAGAIRGQLQEGCSRSQ